MAALAASPGSLPRHLLGPWGQSHGRDRPGSGGHGSSEALPHGLHHGPGHHAANAACGRPWPTASSHFFPGQSTSGRSLDDLRGLLLAGKGDIWIGHVDGFRPGRPALGAPVQPRRRSRAGSKFHILTSRPGTWPHSSMTSGTCPLGTEIACRPGRVAGRGRASGDGKAHGLPAPELCSACAPAARPASTIQGSEDLILVAPKPHGHGASVTRPPALHVRWPAWRRIYGLLTGKRAAMLPIAGIAVNTRHPRTPPRTSRTELEAGPCVQTGNRP